jgi:hypothetical protein
MEAEIRNTKIEEDWRGGATRIAFGRLSTFTNTTASFSTMHERGVVHPWS